MKGFLRAFRFFALILVIAFVSSLVPALVLALPVVASSGYQAAPPAQIDIRAFLQWLVGGGGSILAVSWILERMKWFQALSPDQKDYTIFGFGAVVGCGALAVVMYVPNSVLDVISPFFVVVAATFTAVFIAKLFHKADKVSQARPK